jgi:hypothetical protein
MSAKITILWAVPIGYQPGDYARLFWNSGSGDIDYSQPLTNNKFSLFPNGGGVYGFGQQPFGKAPFGLSFATRVSGFGKLPFGKHPFGYGTTLIKHEQIVDFCGEYKFAFKLFDKLDNENTGTPEEISVDIHIAPPAPTGLKKGTYLQTINVTGVCNPDCTGTYIEDGLFNGLMSYKRDDGEYYIFYRPLEGLIEENYRIGAVKSVETLYYFSRNSQSPVGEYEAFNFPPSVETSGNPVGSVIQKVLTLEAA